MAKFQVEWSLTARGVWGLNAVNEQDADELLGMVSTDRLLESADRLDFQTNPVKIDN